MFGDEQSVHMVRHDAPSAQVVANSIEVKKSILDDGRGVASKQTFTGAIMKMLFTPREARSRIIGPLSFEWKSVCKTEHNVLRHARPIVVR